MPYTNYCTLRNLALLTLAILWTSHSTAQIAQPLTTGTLRLPNALDNSAIGRIAGQSSVSGKRFWVAHFKNIPGPAALRQQGLQIQEKLAHNTFVVMSSALPDKAKLNALQIDATGTMPAPLKLGGGLADGKIPAWAMRGTELSVLISVYTAISDQEALDLLATEGFLAKPLGVALKGVFQLQIPRNRLEDLAALPFVAYVQPSPPPARALNINGRAFAGAFMPGAPLSAGGRGLNGAGVTVGIGDDADPTLHPDLADRVINHSVGSANNHGTHVAGTVGGAGILGYRYAGFAPMARLVAQFFDGIWTNAAQYVQAYNMVITNNSYGLAVNDCRYNGVYDLNARLLDDQAFAHPALLHVFAAGNDGGYTCSPFPNGYATILGGYQSGKNIITVGRSEYDQRYSTSSSSGPVADGRLKPEISALGIIESTNGAGNSYYGDYGTSMSAPNVAGSLALLYQRYHQLHSAANPAGSLMKAILLNAARDIGTPGPDYRYGYGYLQLEPGLRMLENHTYTERTIAHNATTDTVISVLPGQSQLKVMLYWHDPAASPLAQQTLVHDLDLEVIGPGGQVFYPKILNPGAGSVASPAIEAPDHINNSEQVVIDKPAAGSYTIRVRGTDVLAQGSQAFSMAYNQVPINIHFSNPVEGGAWPSGAVGYPGGIPLSWEDEGTPAGMYTLDYSLDNGGQWTNIFTGLRDSFRVYFWIPGNIRSHQARLRLTKTGVPTPAISGKFAIVPNVNYSLAAAADQCPGYIQLNWTPLVASTGETIDYQVLMKQGPAMQAIATLSGSSYTISGLHPDSTYYVAVRARINGVAGIYERTVNRRPNTGGCNGIISDFDLRLDSITAPVTGRQFTSSALAAGSPLQIRVRNLDNAPVSSYEIKYSVNNAPFVSQVINTPLAASASATHSIPIDFSATGPYALVAVVKNMANPDPVAGNDSFKTTIRHLPNPVINLNSPFTDDLENADGTGANLRGTGLAGTHRWDFYSSDVYGRVRSFVTQGIARSGSKAFTLDVSKATPYATSAANNLVGTFNLAGTALNSEVRLDFYFKQHGITQGPNAQNKVWVRGNDAASWTELYDLGANQAPLPGQYKQSASLEISDALAAAGQTFTASTQVRMGQYSLYSMADDTRLGGYSFDDIRLYLASSDARLVAIDTPYLHSCGLGEAVPVRILVRNSMATAMSNVPVSFSINGSTIASETIAAIPANTTLAYTFLQKANLAAPGQYTLEARVNMAGDNVPQNNSFSVVVHNQPVIAGFPYFENFENGAGGYYAQGLNSSWALGTPASRTINTAASGQNAWKTNLAGDYNHTEWSYLYSPCFNINSLAAPTLSFAMAYDLEDCTPYNTVCDDAWMEYSYDNKTWTKLGAAGAGTNWYDYAGTQVWTKSYRDWWHVATIPLPKQPGNITLRFVMRSDLLSARQGLAIDDIHVYDNSLPIFTGPGNSGAIQNNLAGNTLTPFAEAGKTIAAIQPNGNAMGLTTVKAWLYTGPLRNLSKQYLANRNLTIQPTTAQVAPPATVRFYFTDTEVNALRNVSGCSTCLPPKDYTRLGILRYSDDLTDNEDGSLSNNTTGVYTNIAKENIQMVPYDKGYYAAFPSGSFSEFWITDGSTDIALPAGWLSFEARKAIMADGVELTWQTANETLVRQYEVEVSAGNSGRFEKIATLAAKNLPTAQYQFTDSRPGKKGWYMYRIRMVNMDGVASYSATRSLRFEGGKIQLQVWPNPTVGADVKLQISNAATTRIQIQLLDMNGRSLWTGTAHPQNGFTQVWLPMSRLALPNGMYSIRVADGDQIEWQKILVTGR